MNADGSNVRRLTADGGDNRFVAVSPDGAQIAYVSQNAGYPGIDLMLMNADGSNRRVLYQLCVPQAARRSGAVPVPARLVARRHADRLRRGR